VSVFVPAEPGRWWQIDRGVRIIADTGHETEHRALQARERRRLRRLLRQPPDSISVAEIPPSSCVGPTAVQAPRAPQDTELRKLGASTLLGGSRKLHAVPFHTSASVQFGATLPNW
jgi:hypothetical protein